MNDAINPKHYTAHPSGIECIEITRHLSFNRGNAIKYLWRCGKKDAQVQELNKAIWYLRDEIGHGLEAKYDSITMSILIKKLDTLALHQDDDKRQLFNFIVFGGREHLQKAISIIKKMIEELEQ